MTTISSAPREFCQLAEGSQGAAANGVEFRPWLSRYTKLLFALVFGLILKGALVTSHDAGLAVPDWPTSFGENMFTFHPSKWRGIIFFEHVHRLYASLVGMLTVILAVWLWSTPQRRWVRWCALAAVIAVIAQGILGGLTVLYLLPVAISSAHALLGQSFLLIVLLLAYSQSQGFIESGSHLALAPPGSGRRALLLWLAVLMAMLYLQLLVGALMRHSEAGLALLDFPTMAGSWLPWVSTEMVRLTNQMRATVGLTPVNADQVTLHLLHRLGGVLVVVAAIVVAVRARALVRHGDVSSASLHAFKIFLVLLGIQVILGVSVLFTVREPWVTSFHVALGGGVLALVFLTVLRFLNCEGILRARESLNS